MKSNKTLVVGAAMAGLFTGSFAVRTATASVSSPANTAKAGIFAQTLDDTTTGKHDCKGKNACKGQGGCKTSDNGCKGKNSCKGNGGCNTNKKAKSS